MIAFMISNANEREYSYPLFPSLILLSYEEYAVVEQSGVGEECESVSSTLWARVLGVVIRCSKTVEL